MTIPLRLDRLLNRLLDVVLAGLQWLALPLMALLFVQWPLRDLVHGGAVQANDLGQIVFALYVAGSVTAATRAGCHLAADALAHRYRPETRRRLRHVGAACGLLPWAVFVLISAHGTVFDSVRGLERFAETGDAGYFVIKLALWLLAALLAVQGLLELRGGGAEGPG